MTRAGLRPAGGLRPGLTALRERDTAALRGDAVAGLTVAAYLVPQVLAYAAVAGMPPVTGLWAAVAALTAYALLGTSRQLSTGPESTTAIMTAIVVTPLAAGDPARHALLAAALAVLVGIVCLTGRVARLGFLADLLSRPVLVGYLAGIALTMIVGQLQRVTGVPVDGDTVPAQLASFVSGAGRWHPPTVVMAAAVLLFLLAARRFLPRFPAPLVAVGLAAVASATVLPAGLGLQLVGPVPQGLPRPRLPLVSAGDLTSLLLPAVGVAVVAFSDTVLTGRAFASRHRHPLDADQELLALGAANLAAGVLQGFPVGSSGSRTVIADAAGARSQLSSVLTLATVVVILLVGGPVLAAFPTAALGALVVYAAVRLVDVGEFRRRALRALDDAVPAPRRLLLNMEAVLGIDITAVDALLGLCDELDRRGVRLAMAHVKHELHRDLCRGGVTDRIGDDSIYPTLPTAVEEFRRDEGVGTSATTRPEEHP